MKRAAALLIALITAAPAQADEPIAEVSRQTPLGAYGGWSAWSRTQGDRFQLVFRNPQGTTVVPTLPTSSKPWDVSLGPDANGNVVAVYRRCTSRGCDIRRLSTASGREQLLRGVSSPSYDEATPAIWRSTVAFTRRVRGCDVPYVKTLTSSRPSRRLLRSKCLQTPAGHTAIRGTRVLVSSRDRQRSEVRRYSARTSGPSSAVLLRGAGAFGQVAIDEHHTTTVRPDAFVRVRTFGGTPAAIPAHVPLSGSFAKSSNGTYLYLETCVAPAPCRVIEAIHSPFGRQVRALPPRLTIEPGFTGTLTRQIVSDGEVLRTDPIAGVTVELRQRTGETTPFRGVTGPDGRYTIAAPGMTSATAVANTEPVQTWATP